MSTIEDKCFKFHNRGKIYFVVTTKKNRNNADADFILKLLLRDILHEDKEPIHDKVYDNTIKYIKDRMQLCQVKRYLDTHTISFREDCGGGSGYEIIESGKGYIIVQ